MEGGGEKKGGKKGREQGERRYRVGWDVRVWRHAAPVPYPARPGEVPGSNLGAPIFSSCSRRGFLCLGSSVLGGSWLVCFVGMPFPCLDPAGFNENLSAIRGRDRPPPRAVAVKRDETRVGTTLLRSARASTATSLTGRCVGGWACRPRSSAAVTGPARRIPAIRMSECRQRCSPSAKSTIFRCVTSAAVRHSTVPARALGCGETQGSSGRPTTSASSLI